MGSVNEAPMQVPFLLTIEKTNQATLGFSAIKAIVKSHEDPEFVFDLFGGVDIQLSENNIQIFKDLVSGYTKEENITVKAKIKNLIIPPGRAMQVSCKADVGKVESSRSMMFHSDGCEISEGCKCADSKI